MKPALFCGLLVVALVVASWALAEQGEVVLVTTYDEAEKSFRTRLWIVDDGAHVWLRALGPERRWYARLRSQPRIKIEMRADSYRFVAEPEKSERVKARIDHLMREKYGLADELMTLLNGPSDSIPIRLARL